jgi:hypothetical protein
MSGLRVALAVDLVLAAIALSYPQSQMAARILFGIAALIVGWEALSWTKAHRIVRRDRYSKMGKALVECHEESKNLKEQLRFVTSERNRLAAAIEKLKPPPEIRRFP